MSYPPVDALITDIQATLAQCEDMHTANRYLTGLTETHSDFRKLANNVYNYRDYMVNVGMVFTMAAHAGNLQRIRPLHLSSAPEWIGFIKLGNPCQCVLITRIPDIAGQPPVPYSEFFPRSDTTAAVLADAEVLCAANLHCQALCDKRSWHVVPATGRIIIANWSELAFIPSGTTEQVKARLLQKVRDCCGL